MLKIAIGGQLNKNEIRDCLAKYGADKISCEIFTDMDATMKVKNGSFDYYVGACQSGAGGALAMAYALIGRDKCATIANALTQPSEANISQLIDQGKKAFGFTNDRVENSVKALCAVLLVDK
ncbi:putative inner membrane protein [Yersinia kristensenii]|nr:putative inner membrane protein [Yersinia kristensenii]